MCRETARATIYMSFMYHSNNLTNEKMGNASLLALPLKEKVDKNNAFHQVIIHFLSKITQLPGLTHIELVYIYTILLWQF